LPRCSCPYAGTTRIRFEGFPRPDHMGQRRLSPLPGHPLEATIIRGVSHGRQGGRRRGATDGSSIRVFYARCVRFWMARTRSGFTAVMRRRISVALTPGLSENQAGIWSLRSSSIDGRQGRACAAHSGETGEAPLALLPRYAQSGGKTLEIGRDSSLGELRPIHGGSEYALFD
jgi:hypothetical protein